MIRPAILDLDLVVVPREPTEDMWDAFFAARDNDFYVQMEEAKRDGRCWKGLPAVVHSAMLSASPYPTAWDDVRKYVEGMEEKVAFTMTDTSRVLRKPDIEDVCPHPDDCFYESERVRCGPCAVKASKLAGIEIDDTHSHLPEVCRLRREVKAAEARIAELEKRLTDAERVIEPFARLGTMSTHSINEDGTASFSFFRTADMNAFTDARRAARAYMEGK